MEFHFYPDGRIKSVKYSQDEVPHVATGLVAVMPYVLDPENPQFPHVKVDVSGRDRKGFGKIAKPVVAQDIRTIYISGPIKGREEKDYKAHFAKAKAFLEKHGFSVVCPVHTVDHSAHGGSYGEYMRHDVAGMLGCGSIYMLDGWHLSNGARIELVNAIVFGMDIHFESKTKECDMRSMLKDFWPPIDLKKPGEIAVANAPIKELFPVQ